MLTTFQLITLDYWENVYNMVRNVSLKLFYIKFVSFSSRIRNFVFQVISSSGPVSVVFFTVVVFFGSFYLINLMLAVVALSYEEEAEITQEVVCLFFVSFTREKFFPISTQVHRIYSVVNFMRN